MPSRFLRWSWTGRRAQDDEAAPDRTLAKLEEVTRERDALAERLRSIENDERDALARQGLFIIGHSRSGTTILENALNDHPQVFIFNEADIFDDPGTKDFRERHNAKHRAWHNQENKGSFCPMLFDEDESWDRYMVALNRTYRYVGSKIVIHQDRRPGTTEQLFDFMTRRFYASHFIFTFRKPAEVLGSNRGLAAWTGGDAPSVRLVMRSYLWVMGLYLRMLRNLPQVGTVFHDLVSPATFEEIGRRLGLDLGRSWQYYDGAKANTYMPEIEDAEDRRLLERITGYYDLLKQQAASGYDLLQIDQNLASIAPNHATPLGQLAKEIDVILASLATVT